MRHRHWKAAGLALLWPVAVAAAVLAEAILFPHPPLRRQDPAVIAAHLTEKLRSAEARKRFGGAALVLVHNRAIVLEEGFGTANAESGSRVQPDRTLFQLASVSKAVTAWGVMKLVEESKIDLDEPILRHLKRWRFQGSEGYRDKVTVRQLLSHTAGLDDGLGHGGFLPAETVQTLEESLALTKDSTVGPPHGVRVIREPGTAMQYGSGGYSVLQLLIEEVTGREFADYMKAAVLEPLGMTNSGFDWEAIAAAGHGEDLATSFDHDLKPQPRRRYAAKAAVALYATARDLGRFATAHTRANPVLRPQTLQQMLTPQAGTGGSWGLGETLFARNDSGGYIVGHDGGSPPAWGAMMRVNPATGNGLAIVVSGGSGALNRLAHDWVYWETGATTFTARRQLVYDRAAPASAAIVAGWLAIAWMASRKRRSGAQ